MSTSTNARRFLTAAVGFAFLTVLAATTASPQTVTLTPQQQLGKDIYFDTNLSINANQACAACHAAEAGFTGALSDINAHGAVYEGSIDGRFGNRKPPSAAYATQSPILFYTRHAGGMFIGGNFWDGRATGERLGIPAAEQAQGPFLNPLEQALTLPSDVITRICSGMYSGLFVQVCGPTACDPANVSAAYDCVGLSIAAFEASPEVNQFSSKYDKIQMGLATFTPEEQLGLALFTGKAKCDRCHVLGSKGAPALFTDYTFDNLGVPRNPENPFYYEPAFNPQGAAWIDLGLGGFLVTRPLWAAFAPVNYGKEKVPTLRNVDKRPLPTFVKAYSHNGYFKSLKEIVHFYNTRDVLPTCPSGSPGEKVTCWPLPEVSLNMNTKELGNLGLTTAEEDAIVAFMTTLSDGWMP